MNSLKQFLCFANCKMLIIIPTLRYEGANHVYVQLVHESVSKRAGYNLNNVKKSLFQFLADLDFNFCAYQSSNHTQSRYPLAIY